MDIYSDPFKQTVDPSSGLVGKKRQQALTAEQRATHWLAEGNEASEKGNNIKAEKCYDKSQYWWDRYNKITGRSQ